MATFLQSKSSFGFTHYDAKLQKDFSGVATKGLVPFDEWYSTPPLKSGDRITVTEGNAVPADGCQPHGLVVEAGTTLAVLDGGTPHWEAEVEVVHRG